MDDDTPPVHEAEAGWVEPLRDAARSWVMHHVAQTSDLAVNYSTLRNEFLWAAEAAWFDVVAR